MGFYARKLIARMKEDLGWILPEDVRICRCNPGPSTRAAGGFSWVFQSPSRPMLQTIGSQWAVKECARAARITTWRDGWDVFIFPEGAA